MLTAPRRVDENQLLLAKLLYGFLEFIRRIDDGDGKSEDVGIRLELLDRRYAICVRRNERRADALFQDALRGDLRERRRLADARRPQESRDLSLAALEFKAVRHLHVVGEILRQSV